MKRVFVDPSAIKGDTINISDKQQKNHLLHVLRMTKGDSILVLDGAGTEYISEISEETKNGLILKIISSKPFISTSKIEVTIFQGIPKGQKMDDIVRKSTELGVHRIVPLETARVIGDSNYGTFAKKIERFRRIAEEASKQSQRGDIPEVSAPVSLTKAGEMIAGDRSEFDLAILLYELEDGLTLKQALRTYVSNTEVRDRQKIALFIGPEGGFEESEAELLTTCSAVSVTVGDTILRTETAGPAALAMLSYEFEL